MGRRILFVIIIGLGILRSGTLAAQRVIRLYPDSVPNAVPHQIVESQTFEGLVDTVVRNVSVPTLTIFLPPQAKKPLSAVLICPGGGYGALLTKREGSDVARKLNELGVAAFVLKYRLPNQPTMRNPAIGPIQDAQAALAMIRKMADEFGLAKNKIGVLGFSAGGHLASTLGTHFRQSYLPSTDTLGLRPDFMILVNPVISFNDSTGHLGSRDNLLGKSPSPSQVLAFSNELRIDSTTPPTILLHSSADVVVPVENSLAFFNMLHRHKVASALHIYDKGEHGFLTYPSFDEWFGRVVDWMKVQGIAPNTHR